MDDRNFYDFINEDVPMNHNIQKYMMVTRNKLREYGRIAVSYSAGSDSDIMLDMIELKSVARNGGGGMKSMPRLDSCEATPVAVRFCFM